MKYDVFISYSSKDQKIVEGLSAYLEQHKIRCFIAYRDIPKGIDWEEVIVDALNESQMMVVVFSNNYNQSTEVSREIRLASKNNIPILTFRITDDRFEGSKRYYLEGLNWIDAFPNPQIQFGTLTRSIMRLLDMKFISEQNDRGSSQSKTDRETVEEYTAEEQYNLGLCYYYGYDVSQDYKLAFFWFSKSAIQGNAYAQCSLGECYYWGNGVSQNYVEAVSWFRKAAEQNDDEAQCNLGYCYYDGEGISQNYIEAVRWFRKAAEQNYAEAQNNLGSCYYNGKGISQNYVEAVSWFRKAAEQNYAEAQNNLGSCYCNGKGISQNYVEAVSWFRKAAEQNYAEAQCNLGYRYYDGEGISPNYDEAVSWFRKAAIQGNTDAQNILEELEGADEVEALDHKERKMSLGIKQLKQDPWKTIEEKYPVNSKHTAKVCNFTNFGVFVEIEEGVDGLIHISDLSWTKKVRHPSEFTQIGADIEVQVLEIDKENRRLSLGHKQLEENPWGIFETVFTVGSVHEGTIIKMLDKGAVVALPYGVEGFATPKHLVKEDGAQAQLNEKLEFKVIEFNKDAKRIILSHSHIFEDAPIIQNQAASTTLDDIDALAALKKELEGKK